ncbi:MAG TPA: acyl CoA:acetate/3-ketoacid CoA transferase, partial [Albitalea sp.]|nr:acyl CoA:acetate/3-ketoacid CoA transferase [Albitalea sp.]
TFTACGCDVRIAGGRVDIARDGTQIKFVREVEHRTFSGDFARKRGQKVLYVTERCVFRLADSGLELIEIAPGVDLERHILRLMQFTPAISPGLRLMEKGLFGDAAMNLRERMLALPLAQRIELDERSQVLFINFEGLTVDSEQDIADIEAEVEQRVKPLGRRVRVVVNYDHFSIRPELMDAYSAMVQRLTARYYEKVTRYAASGFIRARLS